MWARNLLFLGLVSAGVAALCGSLFPRKVPARVSAPGAEPVPVAEYQDVVDRIDRSFRREWARLQLEPAPPAADLAVARRLALALAGTIPSLQEVRQFEAVPTDRRLAEWVEYLLGDRRHADYFAERLARAYVGTEDGPFIVYRRRKFVAWISDQLAQNRPYDQLVRDLIAGQGLWTDRPATNFVTVTIEPDNKKGPNPERLAARVTRAFLGIRLDCAQCHDHPFEPWKQDDFNGLAAFFGQVHQGFTGIYDGDGDFQVEDRKTRQKRTVEPHVPFRPELLPADGPRRERLARWVTDANNPHFARATVNRVWALMFGRPLVEPVDDLAAAADAPPALQILADDFVAHGHDLRRLLRVIAATEVFQLDSAADPEPTEERQKAWAAFPLTRLRPEQVAGGILQAASLETLNRDSPLLVRMIRAVGENEFVKRYGDTGEDEFEGRGGTIPQRLLLMNGELVYAKTHKDALNVPQRLTWLAPDDPRAVETAFLVVLTRRPTPAEAAHFAARLASRGGAEPGVERDRHQRVEDLFWALLNATEFSWNH